MGDDDREHFDILFAGECLAGHDAAAVRSAVAKLFRADEATLDRLFSGQRQRIKRGVDRATALKYQQALQSAGAKAIVQRAEGGDGGAQTSSSSAAGHEASPRPAAPTGTALSLGAAGEDLLSPAERAKPRASAPSTEHLSVAAAGDDLSQATPTPAPAVRVPDFDVAAAGSDLADATASPPPPPPDTSSIELTEGEFDLSDCHPAPAAPVDLDLSHLEVSAAGADLLRDDERPRREGHVPDTSHLRIEGDDAT
jgi:hypothetical protein